MKKLGIWDGVPSFGTTDERTYIENMTKKLCYNILQNEVNQCLIKTPAQGKLVFEQDLAAWRNTPPPILEAPWGF